MVTTLRIEDFLQFAAGSFKIRTRFAIALLPLLFSCVSPRPEIPMTEVPAAPLVQELDRRRGSFSGLKAAARVQIERKGRKRVYESVAFLQQGQARFRIEGYGPLGESVFDALWDGKDLLLRMPGEADFVRTGPWAFERLIGFPLAPSELAAVLSGNVPPERTSEEARARCSEDGRCVVEFWTDDARWRAHVVPASTFRIESGERYRGGDLAYSARFDAQEMINGYLFPKRITVENADRKAALTIEYQDMEVNVPIEDSAFLLTGAGTGR
jgi:outer membrane lipoprotein-sorting protein